MTSIAWRIRGTVRRDMSGRLSTLELPFRLSRVDFYEQVINLLIFAYSKASRRALQNILISSTEDHAAGIKVPLTRFIGQFELGADLLHIVYVHYGVA
jgi:hypothetical protein